MIYLFYVQFVSIYDTQDIFTIINTLQKLLAFYNWLVDVFPIIHRAATSFSFRPFSAPDGMST